MSPELFDPERVGLKDSHRTESSDCYALGMVLYEVLSERVPFYRYANFVVPGKVVEGKRPERPVGAEGQWFTDDLWKVLEHCWTSQPEHRPKIEDVLQFLEKISGSWMPPSPRVASAPPTTYPFSRDLSSASAEETMALSEISFTQATLSQPSV